MYHRSTRPFAASLGALALFAITACSGSGTVPQAHRAPATVGGKSPGSFAPAPMVRTPLQPASAMTKRPATAIEPPAYTQLPGTATWISAAADGSVWALSDQPSGPDKYIWHYSDGTWTNISGLATQIAAAPDGSVYAINSSGSIYRYASGNWTALGGGASWVTAATDDSVYVVSNAGGQDKALYHYAGGTWTQIGGSGITITASLDTASHSIANGTLAPGGVYITNAAGQIWYENGDGSFVALPGNASSLASTPGGLFAIGYPTTQGGTALYYFDLDAGTWTSEPGSGTGVASDASTLYVVASDGGIYSSPITSSAPAVGATAACSQTPAPDAPAGYQDVGSSFFTTILPHAHQVCMSAWDMSTDLDNALVSAAHNGANVAMLTPWSQHGSNDSDYATLNAAGVYTIWEYTGGAPSTTPPYQSAIHAPMDIHAKFAMVDGIAYVDGHNWFTSDVVMRTGVPADYLAIQNDLLNFPTPAASNGPFTTDKQLSLQSEYQYLQSIAGSVDSTSEIDWSAESYNPTSSASGETDYNQDVFAELCAIASSPAHPAMKFYVESYPYDAKAGTQIQLMVSFNANSHIYSSSGGLEKIALFRKNGVLQSAWFGSSNATSTDLFDWGYTLTDPGMLSALQSWFDSGISGKADKKGSGSADTACLTPNV